MTKLLDGCGCSATAMSRFNRNQMEPTGSPHADASVGQHRGVRVTNYPRSMSSRGLIDQ